MLSIVLRHDLVLWITLSFSRFQSSFFSASSCGPSHVSRYALSSPFVSSSLRLSLSLIQSFLSATVHFLCPFVCLHLSLFYTLFLCFCQFFLHSAWLPVSLSGVARVKLTPPDKDNSLTHSVVYFSPLLFPLFHSIPLVIPHSSFIHPPIQPCLMGFFSLACFYPSVLSVPLPPLAGNLFCPVISLSCCLLFRACLPPSISLSIWLSLYLYLPLSGSICLSMHPDVPPTVLFSLLLNLFNPVSAPPHLCQVI